MNFQKLCLNTITIFTFGLNIDTLNTASAASYLVDVKINQNHSIPSNYLTQQAPWQSPPPINNSTDSQSSINMPQKVPESQSNPETNIVTSNERDRGIQRCVNQKLAYYRQYYWEKRFKLLITDATNNQYAWNDILNPHPNSAYPPAEVELKLVREAQFRANGQDPSIKAIHQENCTIEIDTTLKSYKGFRIPKTALFNFEEERLRIFSYSDEGNALLEQYYSQNQCNGIIRLQGWLLGYLPEPTKDDIYRGRIEQPLDTITPLHLKGTCQVGSMPSVDSSSPPSTDDGLRVE